MRMHFSLIWRVLPHLSVLYRSPRRDLHDADSIEEVLPNHLRIGVLSKSVYRGVGEKSRGG